MNDYEITYIVDGEKRVKILNATNVLEAIKRINALEAIIKVEKI